MGEHETRNLLQREDAIQMFCMFFFDPQTGPSTGPFLLTHVARVKWPVPLYEVHRLMSHLLRQVFRCELLLHNLVVLHEDAVEVWDHHDESHDHTCDHGRQGQQAQNQPPAEGDDATEVEQGRRDQDDADCVVWQKFIDLEDGAVAGLAVPHVGQGDTEEIVKAVGARVVAVVVAALTVKS